MNGLMREGKIKLRTCSFETLIPFKVLSFELRRLLAALFILLETLVEDLMGMEYIWTVAFCIMPSRLLKTGPFHSFLQL